MDKVPEMVTFFSVPMMVASYKVQTAVAILTAGTVAGDIGARACTGRWFSQRPKSIKAVRVETDDEKFMCKIEGELSEEERLTARRPWHIAMSVRTAGYGVICWGSLCGSLGWLWAARKTGSLLASATVPFCTVAVFAMDTIPWAMFPHLVAESLPKFIVMACMVGKGAFVIGLSAGMVNLFGYSNMGWSLITAHILLIALLNRSMWTLVFSVALPTHHDSLRADNPEDEGKLWYLSRSASAAGFIQSAGSLVLMLFLLDPDREHIYATWLTVVPTFIQGACLGSHSMLTSKDSGVDRQTSYIRIFAPLLLVPSLFKYTDIRWILVAQLMGIASSTVLYGTYMEEWEYFSSSQGAILEKFQSADKKIEEKKESVESAA